VDRADPEVTVTARHSLFSFMPYGAPDLIAAQRPLLVRALAVASSAALATFLLAHLVPLSMSLKPVCVSIVPVAPHAITPPPQFEPPPALPKPAPTWPAPYRGPAYPVPVAEVTPPSVPESDVAGVAVDDRTLFGDPSATREPPDGPAPDPPPTRDQFIYTDE